MNKKLSRRDFLKLAGVASTGLSLSACGVDATKLIDPTATPIFTPFPTPTNTPSLTPFPTSTNTPTLTPTPKTPTIGDFGRKIGIEIGVAMTILAVQKGNNFANPDFVNALLNFAFFTDGQASHTAFTEGTDWKNTYAYLVKLSNFAKEHGMSYSPNHLFYGWGHFNKWSPIQSLITAPKDEIEKWMLERAKKIFTIPYFTEINFANEAIITDWRTGSPRWATELENSPFYHAFGKDWVEKAYRITWDEAVRTGRKIGKDLRLVYNSAGIDTQTPQAIFEFKYLKDLKDKLSTDLGIERPFDIGMQFHTRTVDFGVNGCWGSTPAQKLNKKQIVEHLQRFGEVGDIKITEFNICGSDSSDEQKEILHNILEAAIESGVCKQFILWDVFNASNSSTTDDKTWGVKNLFDKNYQPMFMFDELSKIVQSYTAT